MPEEGAEVSPKDEILTFEELARLIGIACSLGITKVRLTGGEPLVRKSLLSLVSMLEPFGIEDLSMTTNGLLLPLHAEGLKRAGMHRVNVSLDTLREDRFAAICRRGSLDQVLDGIVAARQAGLSPIKINCVAMRGVNHDEAAAFAEWSRCEEIHIRFIELMPIRWNLDETSGFESGGSELLRVKQNSGSMLNDLQMRKMTISAEELIADITAECGGLEPADVKTNGPARTFRLAGGLGTVGFISQISNDLCSRCNRLRLTADGFLRPCLMADGELDLRTPMRAGASNEELAGMFLQVVREKPERHYLAEGQKVVGRSMSQIGG